MTHKHGQITCSSVGMFRVSCVCGLSGFFTLFIFKKYFSDIFIKKKKKTQKPKKMLWQSGLLLSSFSPRAGNWSEFFSYFLNSLFFSCCCLLVFWSEVVIFHYIFCLNVILFWLCVFVCDMFDCFHVSSVWLNAFLNVVCLLGCVRLKVFSYEFCFFNVIRLTVFLNVICLIKSVFECDLSEKYVLVQAVWDILSELCNRLLSAKQGLSCMAELVLQKLQGCLLPVLSALSPN